MEIVSILRTSVLSYGWLSEAGLAGLLVSSFACRMPHTARRSLRPHTFERSMLLHCNVSRGLRSQNQASANDGHF